MSLSPKSQLSSKAANMRLQLQIKAKEREDFEVKNKELMAEMVNEKYKLGKPFFFLSFPYSLSFVYLYLFIL